MKKITLNFLKLYNVLPISGPLSILIKKEYRFIYSKVYYCTVHKFHPFLRLFLFPVSMLLWYFKALVSIWANLRLYAQQVKKQTGIGLFKQTQQLIYLSFLKNTRPEYYYHLKLFDTHLIVGETFLARNHFLPIFGFLSDNSSRRLINNKLDFWIKLKPEVNPLIDVLAVVKENEIEFFDAIKDFPETDMFLKPVNGFGGRGCERITYSGNGEYQLDATKFRFNKTNLALYLKHKAKKGDCILQPNLHNHPYLQDMSNGSLCTCRIVTYFDCNKEIKVLFGIFQMPSDESVTSNAMGYNAAVNIETGTLSSAIGHDIFKPIHFHPDAEGRITGTILPFWEDAKDLCKKAHQSFNELPIIAWDVAFTDLEVILVEGNLIWDVEFWQTTHGNCVNTNAFLSMVEWHLKQKLKVNNN